MSTPVILFVIWAVLMVTTPINPLLTGNPYLGLPWFILVQCFALLTVYQASARKGG